MSPDTGSFSERDSSTPGKVVLRRPAATGCGVPLGETSETTAQIPVAGAVLDRRSSRLAGPAVDTSVTSGSAVVRASAPPAPTMPAFGKSVLNGDEGSCG